MRARLLLVPAFAVLAVFAHGAQTPERLSVTVLDENGVAVPSARVTLKPPSPALALRCETGISGVCEFLHVPEGSRQLRVEKEGYYSAVSSIESAGSPEVEVTLNHLKEIKETVDVHESPPMIEPSQTQSQERLTGIDVINIPYPSTHDYRRALNYLPTVVVDSYAQPHISGSQTYQTITVLDGLSGHGRDHAALERAERLAREPSPERRLGGGHERRVEGVGDREPDRRDPAP